MNRLLFLLPLAGLLAAPVYPRPIAATPLAEDECPCAISTYGTDTCSCPVVITSYSGYPVAGDCEFDDPGCGLDRLPCEWKGIVSIQCAGQPVVSKTFSLQTDCGAFPTFRVFNCTGGSGTVTLGVVCEPCQ